MLVVVLAVVALGSVQGQDDCAPPTAGVRLARPNDCCRFDTIVPNALKNNGAKCMQLYPHPPRTPGPPPATPDPASKLFHACMGECIFSEGGLLTADKRLDRAAVTTAFTTTDVNFTPVVTAALNKCFGSYQSDIDQSLQCRSGAEEFRRCVAREVFLNCPSAVWVTTTDCTDLKAKVGRCPQFHVKMKGGPKGPR